MSVNNISIQIKKNKEKKSDSTVLEYLRLPKLTAADVLAHGNEPDAPKPSNLDGV